MFLHKIKYLFFIDLLFIAGCQTIQNQDHHLTYEHTMTISSYKVIDGDTITGLDSEGKPIRIRLTGIDAPEKDQPMGPQSIKNLEQCVGGQPIIINWSKTDKYERVLGKVISQNTDCNLEQIKQGYAWHYKYYENDQPHQEQHQYAEAEIQAKLSQIGLWKFNCPTAPWDWRQKKIVLCN